MNETAEARAERRLASAMLNTSVDATLDLLAEMLNRFAMQADEMQDWLARDRLWKAAEAVETASELLGIMGASNERPCLNYGGLYLRGDPKSATAVSVREYLRMADKER